MNPQSLAALYRNAHNAMRNVDGLQPQEAFDELLKYMLFRQCNEAGAERIGLTRQLNFDGGFRYGDAEAAQRIRQLFQDYLCGFTASARDAWSHTEIRLTDDALLTVHEMFTGVELSQARIDVRSAALRMFLSPELRRGLGIYLTPDEVVRAMVHAVAPVPGTVVFDPACGSGTFLVEVARFWAENSGGSGSGSLLGGDINSRMVLLADLNLGHLDDVRFDCRVADAIGRSSGAHDDWPAPNSVDYIFTNPPFGVYVDHDSVASLGLATARQGGSKLQSEVLFIERCLRWLKPGGLLSIVLPRSVLTNASLHGARCALDELGILGGVMNLPPETFAATGTQTNTCVLFIWKRQTGPIERGNRSVHVVDVSNVGFDSTGRAREGCELPATGVALRDALVGHKPAARVSTLEMDPRTTISQFTDVLNRSRGDQLAVRLGDLVDLAETGRTPARSAYAEAGAFIVKVGNLTGHGIDWTPRSRNYVKSSWVSDRWLLEPGDILLTSSAHNPIYIAKKVDIVGEIPDYIGDATTFVGEVLRLRVRRGRIEPFRLLAILRHPTTKENIRQLIRGQTAHLRPADLLELRVDEALATEDLVENLRAELELSQQFNLLKHQQRVLLGVSDEDE